MAIREALERWRAGEDVAVVAPFTPVDALLSGTTVIVLATDVQAMVVAHAIGGTALLRVTPRSERTRVLASAMKPDRLVVSLESLESPVLQRALSTELAGTPWAALRADELSGVCAGGGWRGPALARARAGCAGGPLLLVHQDRTLAALGAPVDVAEPGALRRVGPDGLGPVEAAAGGLVWGPDAHSEDLGHRLGEIGLARHTPVLRRMQRRLWRAAASDLGNAGVDAFLEPLGSVPSRPVLARGPIGHPSDLAVASGGGLGWSRTAPEPTAVAPSAVDGARAALEGGRSGELLCVRGGELADELLADLAAVGVLQDLRPAWLAARVADQHRFGRPGIDREPAYAELHAAYTAAMGAWSLQERAELALTDRRTMDLRPLAAALSVPPAELSDLLVAMDDDGLVTAWVEPLGGDRDWQARPGPRWAAAATDVAAAVADLRSGRAERLRAAQAVGSAEGCRVGALRGALGLEPGEPCGRCDDCDPSGEGMRAALKEQPVAARAEPAAPKLKAPTLDSLFAGFGQRAPVAAPAKRWTDADLRKALASGEPDRVSEAIEAAGGPVVAWVRAAFDYRGPTGRRDAPPVEIADELVALLRQRAAPDGVQGGRLEVSHRGGPFAGVHRFSRALGATPGLLDAVVAAHDEPGNLAALQAEQGLASSWSAWVGSTFDALLAALDRAAVLDLAALASPWSADVPDGSPWAAVSAAVRAACDGAFEAAVAGLPAVHRHADVRGLWSAAGGSWAALWPAAERLLSDRRSPKTPIERLSARALLAMEPPPELAAAVLVRWLEWADAELGADAVPAERVVAAVTSGERRAFNQLAKRTSKATAAAAAVRADALPIELLDVALEAAPRDAVLAALGDPGPRADVAWRFISQGLDGAGQEALIAELEPINAAVAGAGARRLQVARDRVAAREQILALAAEDRLSDIVPLLAKADPADPDVKAAAQRVAQAQARFTTPLARALAADGHDDEAWGALRAAQEAGWLESVIGLLRAQARRHPADPRRADWLARATWLAGRAADAERAFGEAAKLQDGPPAQVAREMEGVKLALSSGDGDRAARWLVRLIRTQRNRSTARGLTMLAWEGALPAAVAKPVLEALQRDGSGLYASAIRALQDAIRKG